MSTILRSKTVKTRKPHRCFGCARMIPAGVEMERSSIAEDGTVWTCYMCRSCMIVSRNLEPGEDIYFGVLREDAIKLELEAEKEHDSL